MPIFKLSCWMVKVIDLIRYDFLLGRPNVDKPCFCLGLNKVSRGFYICLNIGLTNVLLCTCSLDFQKYSTPPKHGHALTHDRAHNNHCNSLK